MMKQVSVHVGIERRIPLEAREEFNSDDLQYTNTKTQTIFLEYQLQKNVYFIWDSYLQKRENELLSGFQGNSSLDPDSPLRVKTRVNILVKF